MIIPVQRIGQFGLITDLPPDEMPLNSWTDARNVRFRGGAAEKFLGETPVFGNALWSPEWLLHTVQSGTALWLYASPNKAGATDGTTHGDITRVAGGDYTPLPNVGWTGGMIEEIGVINNGFDVPQMWVNPAVGTKLVDLEFWPTDYRINTLRSFKRYLVGLDVTKSGVRYPTMIKWSHQAPSGGVPTSWSVEDTTVDAGEWTLSDEGGYLVDMLALRDVMMLYRENATWQMQYVGGVDVFRFTRLFAEIGCIARKCAVEFFSGKHLIFTGDDVVVNEGQQPRSVMTDRTRKLINLDLTNYARSFVAVDYREKEVWVCFPETGATYCTRAVIWNWVSDTWGVREIPNVGFAMPGIISDPTSGETWDTAVGVWDTDDIAWGDRTSDPTKRRLLMACPAVPNFLLPGLTQQFAGVPMSCMLERRGLGFPLKRDQPPDYSTMKQIIGLWPRISGTQGGVVNVSLGVQGNLNDAPEYIATRSFIIGETGQLDFSDCPTSRLHALKFESATNIEWKMTGYDADVIDRGRHG